MISKQEPRPNGQGFGKPGNVGRAGRFQPVIPTRESLFPEQVCEGFPQPRRRRRHRDSGRFHSIAAVFAPASPFPPEMIAPARATSKVIEATPTQTNVTGATYNSLIFTAVPAGFMDEQMKITVEVPEELYRRAKAQAALEGRRLKDLIEEGLRLVIDPRRKRQQPASLAELTHNARGVVDSGIPDLASNPNHLAGFGHVVRRHR